MMRRLLALLAAGLLLGSCVGGPTSPVQDERPGPPAVAPSAGRADHPGEQDQARSAAARADLAACAYAAGWNLEDLDLKVDAQGLLIGMRYRAEQRRGGVAGEHQTVERCLARAGVTRPAGAP